MFEKLEKLMDGFLEQKVPGYDCVIYKDGKCIYRHSNGYADLENKLPIKGDERYNIYSCSKVITCTAALQLYEKGLFDLDDTLSKYLPEFEHMTVEAEGEILPAKNSITIRHLFTMTAGLNYDRDTYWIKKGIEETGGKCPTREMMKYIARMPLHFEPGTHYCYSLCHDVLAALVEVLSGERFGEYVRKNIFVPAGMTKTTFNLPDDELDTVAINYKYYPETDELKPMGRNIQEGFKFGSEYESGGAGCVSTVDDYIKFLEALRKCILLKRETIDLMQTNQLSESQLKEYWKEDYGYGLGVRCPIEGQPNTDFGWGGAAGAKLAIDMVHNVTMFYVQHVMNPPNDGRFNVYKCAIEEIIDNRM